MVLIGLAICLYYSRALDAFTFGDDAAASLGIAVPWVRLTLFTTTALITATIVSMAGSIGFVGLVDAPRDKCVHFREINGIAAAFQHLQKNYNTPSLCSL